MRTWTSGHHGTVLVFSLLHTGLLIMDDDEPDRMIMIMLRIIQPITITLIQSSSILFVFSRIIASIIRIRPNLYRPAIRYSPNNHYS